MNSEIRSLLVESVTGKFTKKFTVHPHTRRSQMAKHFPAKDILSYVDLTGNHFIWHAGPLSMFSVMARAQTVRMMHWAFDPFVHARLHVCFNHKHLGEFTVPFSAGRERVIFDSIYSQLRAEEPDLPHASFTDFELHENRGMYATKYSRRAFVPHLPTGTSTLLYLLDFRVADAGAPCPHCKRAMLYQGRCLGGYYEYTMHDGSVVRQPRPCGYETPEAMEFGPDGNDEPEEAVFADTARVSSRSGSSRYKSEYHFTEYMSSICGTQNTMVDPRVVGEVRDYLAQRRREVTRSTVKDALQHLETFYKGRYDIWYADAQLIADQINGTPAGTTKHVLTIPKSHQAVLLDLFKCAHLAFRRCPKEVTNGRSNFMRNDFNLWVLAQIAAKQERDPAYLEYKEMVSVNHGPPMLKDAKRAADFINIWRWIIAQVEWDLEL